MQTRTTSEFKRFTDSCAAGHDSFSLSVLYAHGYIDYLLVNAVIYSALLQSGTVFPSVILSSQLFSFIFSLTILLLEGT